MSRVTSVELDAEDVNYVDTLMRESRVRSLKEFVEKCVRFGRQYTLDRWLPGLFYVGPLRVVMMPQRALSIILERVREEDYEDVGRELGEITKSFVLFPYQQDTAKNPEEGVQVMSETGLGQFLMPNKSSIQIISPALPFEMMKAYVETVLGIKLEPVKMKIDVHLFKISS